MMRKIMAEEEQMTTASGDPHPAAGIADMIDLAYAQDFNKATEIFNDQIGQRMTAALDQEKIAIADQIFNDKEEIDDEELEASDETDEAEGGEEDNLDASAEDTEESDPTEEAEEDEEINSET
jgi:hypothetical protein